MATDTVIVVRPEGASVDRGLTQEEWGQISSLPWGPVDKNIVATLRLSKNAVGAEFAPGSIESRMSLINVELNGRGIPFRLRFDQKRGCYYFARRVNAKTTHSS